jgi:hypothetical protein
MSGQVDFFEYAAMHKFLALMQQAFFAGKQRERRIEKRNL